MITDRFEAVSAAVDEHSIQETDAAALCLALARLKCHAVADSRPDAAVIGCDTVVEVDDRILGKPQNADQAREMILLLSGRTHFVHTGVCIAQNGWESAFEVKTAVRLFSIPSAEIERYIQTDEPYDKAGGYGIQGWMSRWLDGIDGDFFNVVGLPVSRIYAQLKLKNFV